MISKTSLFGLVATTIAGQAIAAPLTPIQIDMGEVEFVAADGTIQTAQHIIEVRPMCAFKDQMTQADLVAYAERVIAETPERPRNPTEVIIAKGEGAPQGGSGVTVSFRLFGVVPAGATATLAQVAELYANTFDNNVTINLDVFFDTGFFGATNASQFNVNYDTVRDRLVATADEDDVVPQLLPNNLLPVRDVDGGGVRNENSARICSANARALGGLPTSSVDATLSIGSGANMDYTVTAPGGVTSMQFSALDVIVHEVGHAIGFLSSVGGIGGFRPTPLDFYRFESDQRPTGTADFATTPRFFDADPSEQGRHFFDDLTFGVRFENDSNFQSSHWLNAGSNPIGVMDPQIINGFTLFPDLLSEDDIAAFDAIGWDFSVPVIPLPCNAADLAEPFGQHDIADVVSFLTFFGAGVPFVDLAPPFGELDIADVVTFLNLFGQGCP